AVLGHEIDRRRRHLAGRHTQIALVLAALVVHQDHHLARLDVGDGILDGTDLPGPLGRRPERREHGLPAIARVDGTRKNRTAAVDMKGDRGIVCAIGPGWERGPPARWPFASRACALSRADRGGPPALPACPYAGLCQC